jgi:hypothetical protein
MITNIAVAASVRSRPQPVEDHAFGIRKRFLTRMTDVPFFRTTMHTNIAFSNLSSCVTVNSRAKYLLWVHWSTSYGLITTRVCQ